MKKHLALFVMSLVSSFSTFAQDPGMAQTTDE